MRPDSGIDQTSLAWLKPEIDTSLERAGRSLERYADEGYSGDGAEAAAAALHEVLGGLRMLELYGAALVAEEMERLTSELVNGKVQRVEDALTSLLRAVLQLPDYLERLQSGFRDVPIVLLPLLNDLRSCRGEKLLSESVLLIPPSDPELPQQLPVPATRLGSVDLERSLVGLRREWQFALLHWFRGHNSDQALARLADICDRVLAVVHIRPARQLWWVASAITEALREHTLDASISTKLLFGRLDRELKRLIDQGELLYSESLPDELQRSMLYYVAQAGGGERVSQAQDAFKLNELMPSAEEIDEARGALSGRNSSLLDSVVQALEEELLRVKDALDLYLRGSQSDASPLKPELDVLDRVGDTLGMIGMGIERSHVKAQREALATLVDGGVGGVGGEHVLLNVAGELLKVENALQEHRERLGIQSQDELSRGDDGRLSTGERRRLVQAVLREATVNLQQSKDLFLAHMSAEPGNVHHPLAVALLRDVAGALRLLQFEHAGERALALAGFLLADGAGSAELSAEQVDAFADALSGLEFYLELTNDHGGQGERRLDLVTRALTRLGHWPSRVSLHELFGIEATAEAASATAKGATGNRSSDTGMEGSTGPLAESAPDTAPTSGADQPARLDAGGSEAEAAESEALPSIGSDDPLAAEFASSREGFVQFVVANGFGFDANGAAGDDEEIRSTFLDELTEEVVNLDQALQECRAAPDDVERLRNIRRSFHTIKGSGRMVGALTLGEFAWQVESLLNRVLGGQRPNSIAVMRLVEHCVSALPEFHAALCGDVPPRRDVASLMAAAHLLAEGHEYLLPSTVPMLVSAEVPAAIASADDGQTDAAPVDVPADMSEGVTTAASGHEAAHGMLPVAETEIVPEAAAETSVSADTETERETISIPLHLDPVLMDILRSEVAGHLGVIDTYLDDARSNSALAIVPEHLLRAVHTLNGAFGAVELPEVTVLTSSLEAYVRRLRGLQRAPSRDGHQSLAAASRWLGEVLECLDNGRRPAELSDLPEKLRKLTAELPDLSQQSAWYRGEPLLGEDEEEAAVEEVQDSIPTGLDEVPDLTDPELLLQPDDGESVTGGQPVSETSIAEFEHDESLADAMAELSADLDATGSLEYQPPGQLVDTAPIEHQSPEIEVSAPTIDKVESQGVEISAPTSAEPPPEIGESDDQVEGRADRNALRQMLETLPNIAPTDVDADLAELYREEARELLDRCEQHLAAKDQIGFDRLQQELARELHTLKGGARMAGFVDAGDLGHAMESLLEAAVNDQRQLADADFVLVGRCLDRLNQLIFPGATPVIAAPAPEMPVVAHTSSKPADNKPRAAIEAEAEAEAKAIRSAALPSAPVQPMPTVAPRPVTVVAPVIQTVVADSGVGEFVRVRADQLDSLVNLAGEVGIIRTRLEQQVGAFRFSLEEFEQTVLRLREQLRKLEIEAETQILSREVRVQEQSGSTGFDPLEMDRFSQLQQLSRALAESMSDLQSIQGLLDEHTRLAESLLLQQSRAGAELQEGLMRARMVPFESMLPRLRRLVRQEADALGKRVRLEVQGAQGELDRGVLERMAAPFEHMLRNALVHGLETPEERRQSGKSDEGEVRIRVSREATEVVIEVSDDGRGIDPQRVRRTAIERGLLAAESDLSDRDLYGFILEPGFSTAGELTQYAGRGVGLDVVASEIKQLGGSLTIDSAIGQGANFRIRLPYTLAVSQAVLVRVSDHTFAIPMVGVQGIVRLSYLAYKDRIVDARPKVDYAGEDYEIYELDNVIGMSAAITDDNAQVPLLMVRAGDLRVALRVDSLLGGREIVVKPVGPQLARIPGVFGATILGDGAVVVILDVAALLRRAAALRERGDAPAVATLQPAVRQRPLVLVVDDSITMRKVSSRVLEREGYEVQTAKDGLDALEHVHERLPDVILLDLEMPRMDGYEFAGYMRNDPRLRDVPIVVITSRTGEKHRNRAYELGVNRYLGKPYQESEMLTAVAELLAERATAH